MRVTLREKEGIVDMCSHVHTQTSVKLSAVEDTAVVKWYYRIIYFDP